MNTVDALKTLTDRVRQIGISEFARRRQISKGTVHGVLARNCIHLTVPEANLWMREVGLILAAHHDRVHKWDKTITDAVRQAEQRASKKPKFGAQLKLTKGGRK